MTGEFAAISTLRTLLPVPPDTVGIWIGDDAAAISLPSAPARDDSEGEGEDRWLLLAADTVVGGVHADLSLTGIDDLGWKAMAASISDVAAMGGDPGHALVTVAAPPDTDLTVLYEGIAAAAREFSCPVVGGDLTNAVDIVVTVAVTGYASGRPVSRGGARPGDVIWVTGPLGASAAGLRLLRSQRGQPGQRGQLGQPAGRWVGFATVELDAIRAHARPRPQLPAGRAARRAGATAMIDISDGLSADLDHVATASGVGIQLDSVPVHPAATLEEALSGGEDFALAFCAPESAGVEVAFAALATPIAIGRCTSDPGERTLGGEPFSPSGWQHRWAT